MITLRTIFLFSFICVFTSCSVEEAGRYVCNCDQKKRVQQFIERSIKPANNFSDEEMEHVIHELWVIGVKLNCNIKVLPLNSRNLIDWSRVNLDTCEIAYNNVY